MEDNHYCVKNKGPQPNISYFTYTLQPR